MIALLGYGKTNQAILSLLNSQNQTCLVFDDSFLQATQDQKGNQFLPSSHKKKGDCDMEIISPGIPPSHLLVKNSSHLVSEYDFLLDQNKTQIWISGTNGKTTTTEMLSWILKDFGGMSGGNIGTPLARLVELDPRIWILETSSFTLHYTREVSPFVYLLLPVREDHISWHGSFENYVQAKLKPLDLMQQGSVALIPEAFKDSNQAKRSKAQLLFYKESKDLARMFDFGDIALNEPFLLDALVALSGAKILCHQDLSHRLIDFKIGKHKLQEVQDALGRIWVDDSKGTNVDATIWAIRAYKDRKIYLILGGDDKGADLRPLFDEISQREIEIFGIGSNVSKLQSLAQEYQLAFTPCFDLQKAVLAIARVHSTHSIAMLSPAAASLDQFTSYKERGESFQKLIGVVAKDMKL